MNDRRYREIRRNVDGAIATLTPPARERLGALIGNMLLIDSLGLPVPTSLIPARVAALRPAPVFNRDVATVIHNAIGGKA